MVVLTAAYSLRPAIRACDAAAKRPPGRCEAAAVKTPKHPFARKSHFTQTEKKNTQPKRIYSANGNPFMPMIYRFCDKSTNLQRS